MRVLLVSVGSLGDTLPFIAWAKELETRGHEVILGVNGYYQSLLDREGVRWESLYSREEHAGALEQSQVWQESNPLHIGKDWFTTLLPRAYDFVARHHLPGETVVAAQNVFAGARVAQEVLGVPTASLHLQPLFLRSIYDPTGAPYHWPMCFRRGLDRGIDWVLDGWMGKPLNEFRQKFGLAPVRRTMKTWWNSPELVINFFPEWFNPPQPDWPPNTITVGFPFFRNQQLDYDRAGVEEFMNAGSPPIVFSVSSFTQDARPYFQASMAAAAELGQRAVFLTPYQDQVPSSLPSTVRYFHFVPLEAILSRSLLHVHHCGSGTLALTFDAGIPHLAVPQGMDQVDIAGRLERLGVSRTINPKKYSAPAVVQACRQLLGEPAVSERCADFQKKSREQRALQEASDALERLLDAEAGRRPLRPNQFSSKD